MRSAKIRVSLGQVFYHAFWLYHDHLGKLILLNFVAFLLDLTVLVWGVAFAVLVAVVNGCFRNETIDVRAVVRLTRQHWRWGLGYGLLVLVVSIALFANILFYLHLSPLSFFFTGLAGLFVWLLFFFFIVTLWLFPLKILFGKPLQQNIKTALYLIFDNLVSSLFVGMICLVILVVGAVTAVGLVFISWGLMAVLVTVTVQQQLRRYNLLTSRELEENRSWKDLIQPWEFSLNNSCAPRFKDIKY